MLKKVMNSYCVNILAKIFLKVISIAKEYSWAPKVVADLRILKDKRVLNHVITMVYGSPSFSAGFFNWTIGI